MVVQFLVPYAAFVLFSYEFLANQDPPVVFGIDFLNGDVKEVCYFYHECHVFRRGFATEFISPLGMNLTRNRRQWRNKNLESSHQTLLKNWPSTAYGKLASKFCFRNCETKALLDNVQEAPLAF